MNTVSSAEFQRHVGRYQDSALSEPVLLTHNGRERLVLLSVDEYRRLKRLDREVLAVSELSPDDIREILSSRVPAEYDYLNDELSS